jgi:hypothetical protein
MTALAARLGVPIKAYSHITPTIYGGAETFPSQSPEYLVLTRARKPFQGCNAGRTAFHVALSDIPCVELSSSSLLILFVVMSPDGVVRAGCEAAVEDADKAGGELAQRCMVAGASPA